jgi:hypothetical protein
VSSNKEEYIDDFGADDGIAEEVSIGNDIEDEIEDDYDF